MERQTILDFAVIIVSVIVVIHPFFGNFQLQMDDYRYIRQVRDILSDNKLPFTKLTTITNTWNQLWWHSIDSKIVFFRPMVIFSYLIDYLLWGTNSTGYMITNIIVHTVCSVLVYLIFIPIFNSRRYALYAGILFAVHPVHGETLWYAAGRTDSMYVMFWLLAFILYQRSKKQSTPFYFISLASFFLALLTKEISFTLPIVLFIYDLYFAGDDFKGTIKRNYKRYAGYIVVFLIYYAIRFALTDTILFNQMIYPYFFTPSHPGFLLHLGVILLLYVFNLVTLYHTPAFFVSDSLFISQIFSKYVYHLLITAVFSITVYILSKKEKKFNLLILWFFITWLPTSIVYTSERYLYLPSVAFIGILILLIIKLVQISNSKKYVTVLTFVIILASAYAVMLYIENYVISITPQEAQIILKSFNNTFSHTGDMINADIFILNYFNMYTGAVFLEDMLRVEYDNSELDVRILITMPNSINSSYSIIVEKTGDNSLTVLSTAPLFTKDSWDFDILELKAGVEKQMEDFKVEILSASDTGVNSLRFIFNQSLDDYIFIAYEPTSEEFEIIDFNSENIKRIEISAIPDDSHV